MSILKNVFGNPIANEVVGPDRKVVPLPPVDRNAQMAQVMQQPTPKPIVPKIITYDLIKRTIVQVRENELIGKGKMSKDERLAEELFCLVRHYEPETKLTYERIVQAILFVKTNDIMGAGQWSKEDHLAEYLYALVRMSGTNSPGLRASEQIEASIMSVGTSPKTPRAPRATTVSPAPTTTSPASQPIADSILG